MKLQGPFGIAGQLEIAALHRIKQIGVVKRLRRLPVNSQRQRHTRRRLNHLQWREFFRGGGAIFFEFKALQPGACRGEDCDVVFRLDFDIARRLRAENFCRSGWRSGNGRRILCIGQRFSRS